MMLGRERRYIHTEQLISAMAMVAKKLRSYFKAYNVMVLTRQPLKLILIKLGILGRMVY